MVNEDVNSIVHNSYIFLFDCTQVYGCFMVFAYFNRLEIIST